MPVYFARQLWIETGPCRPGTDPRHAVVGGIGPIAVQHDAVRVAKTLMDSGEVGRLGVGTAKRGASRTATPPVFKQPRAEVRR